ncbi:DUF1127 domain-containing protein [Nitratireductor basaltis]|uniref:YjiS-like domain-containing protein n=1 Tax=Nitratireductor basaltis TaxID=472175 RepID=A0A084UDQ9_9HYPH|nr:DUF1127 domain-containing protein [Nitratireductor basaltis]KFB11095.1 hypothetical protein EL18_02138 [Nitratireductor basaltis]
MNTSGAIRVRQPGPLSLQRVAKALASAYRAWLGRRAMASLDELEDWQLADIGLQRCDIDRLRGFTPLRDPTVELHERRVVAANITRRHD